MAIAVGGRADLATLEADDDAREDVTRGEIGDATGDDGGGVGGRRGDGDQKREKARKEKTQTKCGPDARQNSRQKRTGGANGFHGRE
jgi:hypothetical protein